MTTRFTRRGTSKYFFAATVAALGAVTRANITAATNLSPSIADIAGWTLENQPIPTPDMGSDFDSSIPGSDSAADSSFTFYEDFDAETLDTLLPKGTAGFVIIMRKGDKPASTSMDVFPVRVGSKSAEHTVGNDPARTMVKFTITGKPSLDQAVPAAA